MRDREDRDPRLARLGVEQRARRRAARPPSRPAKPGDASRLLSRIASSKRSLAGKNDSRSSTPTRSNGGLWIRGSAPPRSRSRPSRQRGRAASRAGCARGCGSGRRRSRAGRAGSVTVVAIRSRSSVAVLEQRRRRRGERAQTIEIGMPGVAARACRSRTRPPRAAGGCARRPGPTRRAPCATARPAPRRTRRASGPCARASSSSIQGRKSLGARAPGRSAAGCPGRPWGRSRAPGCRRSRPPRAGRCRGRSCRCRSCRHRPRGSSGPSSRRAAARRAARRPRGRTAGRGRRRRASRSSVGSSFLQGVLTERPDRRVPGQGYRPPSAPGNR